ncbi:MAG: glycosyltransferase family 4 protein, partial [Candidatus Gracilibacteria bacterium]|nr:glycosyltransferase family 4 protein [Candidatus Gracilibacteria bacterium]
LVKLGGAEKVVEQMLELFPDADLFTLIYDEKKVGNIFPKNKIHPQVFGLMSQKVYKYTKKQRLCLPFMAQSIEALDFSEYDIVIASSSGFAHGAITKPDTKFLVYYHSPARYMWDWTNEYKKDIGWNSGIKGLFLNKFFLKTRQWDVMASNRADIVVANAKNTQKRIQKYYRRDAHILYPPVETSRFQKEVSSDVFHSLEKNFQLSSKYYIIISALTEFKKLDIAVSAFNKLTNQQLIIIGAGNYQETLQKQTQSNNIIFTGPQYGDDLVSLVQHSEGLIFPGEEDFGIVPIEVMAAGKPVFALRAGGLLETVQEGITGDFFNSPEGDDFVEKFTLFEKKIESGQYKSQACQKQADNFSEVIWKQNLLSLLQ